MSYTHGKVTIICQQCGNSQKVYASWASKKYCSTKCAGLTRQGKPGPRLGQKATPETLRKLRDSHLGQKAWNKGLTGFLAGDKHHNWQEENPTYRAVHGWINKQLGKPSMCEHCKTTNAKRFEWANISGKYMRDITDWVRLCKSCHNIYDETGYKSWNTRRGALGL